MREFMKVVEGGEPKLYFHVTWASRIPNIKREGLLIGKRRNWKNPFGSMQGSRDVLYIMDDFSAAVRWAHKMEWDAKRSAAIVVLRSVPGEIDPDEHIDAVLSGNGHWLTTDQNIPADLIASVIPMSIALARQVANGGVAELPPL